MITLTFVAAIIVGLFLTSRIDLSFSSSLETFSGPRAYPGMILSVLLMLNLIVAASQLRGADWQSSQETEREPFLDKRATWSAALFLSLLAFVLTFEGIGYILTMIPLLTLVGWLCGARNLLLVFIVAVGLSGVCLVIFRYGLATVLPEGVLGIDSVF